MLLLRPARLMNQRSRHTGNGKEMLVRFVGIRGSRVPTTNKKNGQLEITRSKCARYMIRAVLNSSENSGYVKVPDVRIVLRVDN